MIFNNYFFTGWMYGDKLEKLLAAKIKIELTLINNRHRVPTYGQTFFPRARTTSTSTRPPLNGH